MAATGDMTNQPSSDVAFTSTVKEIQRQRGSRDLYERMEESGGFHTEVDERLTAFLSRLNSFFLATASAEGQPYIQHRGGPPGFLRVLDSRTLGFADYSGNRQYISLGNLTENDRVCLFLMDYARQRRIKIWGRARVEQGPEWIGKLMPADYRGTPEQVILITVDAWDTNCPQHIPHLVPFSDLETVRKTLENRIAELEAELLGLRQVKSPAPKTP